MLIGALDRLTLIVEIMKPLEVRPTSGGQLKTRAIQLLRRLACHAGPYARRAEGHDPGLGEDDAQAIGNAELRPTGPYLP
jgi:hypothetical protein